MGALPDEVVERLSTCGPVRLVTGPEEAPLGVEAHLAPLHKQLYAFVFKGSATEANLLAHGGIELQADDKAGDWSIRVHGRGVAGRAVLADPRRSELMHWLPDGVSPHGLVAARIHPEAVEYVKGKGSGRTRAAGPVPGGPAPPPPARWTRLATEGALPLFALMIVADWALMLLFEEREHRRALILGVMVVAGALLLGGENLWNHANVFGRWREGFETEEGAALMLEAWEPAGRVRSFGLAAVAAGVALSVFLAAVVGVHAGAIALFSGGAPVRFVIHLVRHSMRRRDAAGERPS